MWVAVAFRAARRTLALTRRFYALSVTQKIIRDGHLAPAVNMCTPASRIVLSDTEAWNSWNNGGAITAEERRVCSLFILHGDHELLLFLLILLHFSAHPKSHLHRCIGLTTHQCQLMDHINTCLLFTSGRLRSMAIYTLVSHVSLRYPADHLCSRSKGTILRQTSKKTKYLRIMCRFIQLLTFEGKSFATTTSVC